MSAHDAERTPTSICPHCDYEIDAATPSDFGAQKPKPGDLSVCLNCAGLLTYNDDLTMRAFTDSEYEALPDDTKMELYRVRVAVRRVNMKGKKAKRTDMR